jgi:acyl-CoA thioester hydrolase
MAADWPDLAGRLEGGVHRLPVRVYFEDTDFSGFVYHANYLKFCERGRSDFLRFAGAHHHALAAEGLAFVVRRMVCDFLATARIDDVLVVETRVAALTGARMELTQCVFRGGDPGRLFEAQVTAALVDRDGRPRRLPQALRRQMSAVARRP